MRITKLTLMFASFFMIGIATANADKVVSRSKSITVEKISTPHPMEWFLKAGGGITAVTEGDNIGNYNAALGFKRYFSHEPKGGYWGAMLGSTLYGNAYRVGYYDSFGNWYEKVYTEPKFSLYLGPQIGYAKPINESLTFDVHLLVAYQLALNEYYREAGHHIIGQLGLGLWIKRFLVELDYQPSFIDNESHSFMFNIGYRF